MATFTALYHDLEIVVPDSARTVTGFRAWVTSHDFPQRGRVSFIEREVLVDMSPERLELHIKVKGEIGHVITSLSKATRSGTYYSDGTLVSNDEAELSTEPDGTFVSFESFRSGRARLVPIAGDEELALEIEGTPDWVCEVVSDSSVRKDTVLLPRAYHLAGIPEYWLVDARRDEIAFTILINEANGYVAAEVVDGWQASPVFGRKFQLRRERNAVGHWDYTLLEQPVS
jgi:Uma2 family endonuclease